MNNFRIWTFLKSKHLLEMNIIQNHIQMTKNITWKNKRKKEKENVNKTKKEQFKIRTFSKKWAFFKFKHFL